MAQTNDPKINPRRKSVLQKRYDSTAIWTIPNIISFARLIGTFVLIGIAVAELRFWFVGIYAVLGISDWVDGVYARWMNQRSELGARLDAVADAFLNVTLMIGILILCPETLQKEFVWFLIAVSSYLAAVSLGLWKYRRVTAYHTYAAKITHGLVWIAAICLLLQWSVWPLRVAAFAATITNLETIAIICSLDKWQADVPSLFSVSRLRTSTTDKEDIVEDKLPEGEAT